MSMSSSSTSRLPPRVRVIESSGSIYEAGGGAGKKDLNFDSLATGQHDMFRRTIELESKFQITRREMEERQLTVDDKPVQLRVNVSREDFPDISSDIDVSYFKSASQQGWDIFLKQVCLQLKIEFIHSILDRSDKSPVFRILRLRPNGEYLVRQRESSAILEVINTGKNPAEISWPITQNINHIKRELAFDLKSLPVMEKRVEKLVAKPAIRDRQIEVTAQILSATTPEEAIKAIETFHLQYLNGDVPLVLTAEEEADALIGFQKEREIRFGDTTIYTDAIDIVRLHRMVLESLSRFAAQGGAVAAQHIAKFNVKHIVRVIEGLRAEVDVAVLGLKLLSDISKYLTNTRDKMYNVILDCVQAYSPPAPPNRPRNPARLRPPQEMYDLSGALDAAPGTGGLGFDLPVMSGVGNIELRRYGDFYGHSAAIGTDDSLGDQPRSEASEMAAILAQKEEENAGLDELQEGEDDQNDESLLDSERKASDAPAGVLVGPNGKPLEIKAIITQRQRIDRSAATRALTTAFSDTTLSDATAADDSKAVGRLPAFLADSNQDSMNDRYSVVSVATKAPRIRFKVKEREKVDASAAGGKRQWKGTTGEIGRRAVKVEVEVQIDFQKKVIQDPFADESVEATGGQNLAVATRESGGDKMETSSGAPVLQLSAASGGELVAAGLDAAASSFQAARTNGAELKDVRYKPKKKRGKTKFVLQPLPLVPCIIFKGFSGKMRQNIALQQAFTTLFKMVTENYGNRETAFRMGILDEICDVALVCQGLPRVLEYVIWIANAMYSEGFGEEEEVDDNVLVLNSTDDYSMVLSVTVASEMQPRQGCDRGGDDCVSLNTMTNEVIETISDMSVPSVDEDGEYSEATPEVNMGDFALDYAALEEVKSRDAALLEEERVKQAKRDLAASAAQVAGPNTSGRNIVATTPKKVGEDEKSADVTGIAVGNNNRVKSPKKRQPAGTRRVPNKDVVKVVGQATYEARYVNRPSDIVVLAMALIESHHEISLRERQMATRWLDTWDDNSRDFKLLKKKGMDMCGI